MEQHSTDASIKSSWSSRHDEVGKEEKRENLIHRRMCHLFLELNDETRSLMAKIDEMRDNLFRRTEFISAKFILEFINCRYLSLHLRLYGINIGLLIK